ncbi:MAG TPA: hypothetical protein VGW10_17975 [Solirubrobacteraceae bacterium]|nr:hypothetical protein [Solirubrobacteraceae bacterium]
MRFPCLLAVLVFAALPSSTAVASGGTYTHVLCANPDTGRGVVGADARLPDGTTNPWNIQFAAVSEARSRCNGVIDGEAGIPVTTGAGWTSDEANKGGALRYRAPEGITFNGGTIYRYGVVSGRFAWTVSRNGRWDHIFGQPNDDHCTWGDGCSSRGTPGAPWSDLNRVTVGSNEVNGFDVSMLCDIPQGWQCHADGNQTVRVYGGKLALEDRAAPTPGAATGSLASAAVLSGIADVDFNASDAGSGLYRVRVVVDGVTRLSRVVHEDGGRCADVNPANGDDYEFAYQRPCRASAGVSAAFDTRSVADGEVALRVAVEDAGGNAVTVVNRRVRIDNVPAPTNVAAPSVDGVPRRGSGLALVPGSWDDHGAAGDPAIAHQWQRCRYDGAACVDVPGATGPTFVLGTGEVGRRIRVVETASNREGRGQSVSALTSVVTREDGTLPPDQDGTDNDGDGEVDEPGETDPGTGSGGGGSGGGGSGSGGHTDNPSSAGGTRLPVKAGEPSSSGAASGANGEGASPRARLTVAFAGRPGAVRTVKFGQGTTVTGRLVDEHDRPIRNAIVDVHATPALRGAAAAPAQPAVTGSDGAFTYRVDGRASSRALRFTYRYLRAGDVVADAALTLRVRAAIRLSVKLRGIAVRYSGRVLSGQVPKAGKLVVLQGRVRGGRWQTFATRRAKGRGTFRGAYRLKVRRPGVRLQFRARAVAESGWPYLEATSRTVTRRVK